MSGRRAKKLRKQYKGLASQVALDEIREGIRVYNRKMERRRRNPLYRLLKRVREGIRRLWAEESPA